MLKKRFKNIFFSVFILLIFTSNTLFSLTTEEIKKRVKKGYDTTGIILKIGNQKQLLFDNYIIEDIWNIERHLNKPQRYPENPVIHFDRPWEEWNVPGVKSGGPAVSTVFYDKEDKLFKMWYTVFRILNRKKPYLYTYWTAYAYSKDGIHWIKPNLGVIEFNGSKNNNLVYKGRFWASGRVVKDYNEKDPKKRYKFYYSDVYGVLPLSKIKAEDEGKKWTVKWFQDNWIDTTNLAFSPDGIHWTPYKDNPVEVFGLADGQGDAFWDDRIKMFVSSRRPLVYAGPWMRRIAISFSKDLIHWTFPKTVIIPDELDTIELYDLRIFPYENIYYGFLSMFDSDKKQNIVQQLVFSRDLLHWERLAKREAFIGLGKEGEFDAGMVSPAKPLVVKNKIYIYYSGTNKSHSSYSSKTEIGLLTIPLDRFVGRRTKIQTDKFVDRNGDFKVGKNPEVGVILTRPFICEGDTLEINCKCPKGVIKVEVLNTIGEVYKGFGKKYSIPFQGDSLSHKMMWKDHSLKELMGKAIRLKFYMINAELYSFKISSKINN